MNKNLTYTLISILWPLVGFFVLIVIGSQVSWSSWYPPITAIGLVAVIFLAYAVSFLFSHRLVTYPIRNPILLFMLVVCITHVGAIAIPGTFRFYYSRSFILVSLLVTLSWISIGYLITAHQKSKKRVGLVSNSYSNKLSLMSDYRWFDITAIPSLEEIDYDIISADLHGNLTDDWKRFLADASLSGVLVVDSAALYESLAGRISLSHLGNSSIDEVKTQHPAYLPIKRILDLLFIITFSPLIVIVMSIIAIAIRIEGRGPIIFVQKRIGYRNKLFKLYKFRSMSNFTENYEPRFTGKDDQRITHVGRILRKHRLDELPQLINVLSGKMSLIGPRPEQQDFVEEYSKTIAFYPYRHSVKPGITGWAQVSQGYTSSEESTREKLEHDFYYIKHVSPWLDLLILIKTFNTIIGGYGSRY